MDISTQKGASLEFYKCDSLLFNDIRSKKPLENQSVIKVTECKNALLNNCFQRINTDVFLETKNSEVIQGSNFLSLVKEPIKEIK